MVGSVTQGVGFSPNNAGTSADVITIGSSTYTANPSGTYLIAGHTLLSRSAIMVAGTPLSLASQATAVVVASSTQTVSHPSQITAAKAGVVTVGSKTFTANPSGVYVIAGQILRPGSAITVSGTPISLGTQATNIVIGSSTQAVSIPYQITGSSGPGIITVDSSTYTANAQGAYIIAGQTLRPGYPVTVSGTPLYLGPQATSVVVGMSTEAVLFPESSRVITIGTSTYTVTSGKYVIDGQTLRPGSVITVAGTPISFPANPTAIVVGTSTESVGLGGAIMSGFGAMTTGVLPFAGGGARLSVPFSVLMGVGVGYTVCMV